MYFFLKFSITVKCQCGALEESQAGDPEEKGSSPYCVIKLSAGMALQALNYACAVFSGGFTSYLRNG